MKEFNIKLGLLVVIASRDENTMSKVFARADQELNAAANALQSAKVESAYLAAAKQVEDAETMLNRPVASVTLADEIQYFSTIEMEERALEAKHLADQEYASRISRAAEQLEAMATKNIQASAELMSEMAARLKDMDALMARASRLVDSRAGVQAGSIEMLNKNLAEARKALLSRSTEFNARANAASTDELAAVKRLSNGAPELQSKLMNLQSQLQSKQAQ
jgi:hypothetical protein